MAKVERKLARDGRSFSERTVYVKCKSCAYNFPMRLSRSYIGIAFAFTAFISLCASAQETPANKLSILSKDLPVASLWNAYGLQGKFGFSLQSSGGVGTHHWRVSSGALPRGMKLDEIGTLMGVPEQSGEFHFTVLLTDGHEEVRRKFTVTVQPPFRTDWSRKAQVNGNRIEGSIKVSNTTGRDFDLTFVVLAVNDIGRATAIGYQHFPLKKNTRDMELPFGDTLSYGNYAVNIDVVGEELESKMIFRTRLVAPKLVIAQSP
jgi:hypothetical protein